MRLLVALILLAAFLPIPTASASGYSVGAVVSVLTDGSADYVWHLSGLSGGLTFPIPDNATFVEARDAGGRLLSADVSNGQVSVGATPALVKFHLGGHADGPFTIFPAQVAAQPTSAVTVGITLPAGWSFAGYRDNNEQKPDGTGTFHETGPAYVEYLVLSPGHADPGPDARVSGNSVRREATADINLTGVDWTLTTTYDTDVYSRDWDVNVPEGATVVNASTPLGPLDTTPQADGIHVHTPYPVGFGLGGRSFSVTMRLPPPDMHGGAFRLSNLSVRAAPGDVVTIDATRTAGMRYAGARIAGGVEVAPLRYQGNGPLSVGIALLPPADTGHVQFTAGVFIVDAPSSLAAAARATAQNASDLLPRTSAFVYDANDTRPFYVSYTSAPVFGWEEGFYSNGLNTISVRASTLANVTDGKAHLAPVSILIHEATHGLVDRRVPEAPHNLSFFHEGLSRLAETNTESFFPVYPEIISCSNTTLNSRCDRHSARPGADEIEARYQHGTTFDVAWGAQTASDADRGALYDYSGLVLHAFNEWAPAGALKNVMSTVNATTFRGPDSNDANALIGILLANAPGATAQAILYPGAPAASLPLEQFRSCMGDLLAPPYPWETTTRPSGGCPSNGYGERDATLPTPPPTPSPTPETTPSPTPAIASPEPRISPPMTVTPTPGDDISVPATGEVPGAADQPSAPSAPGGGVAIPAPGAVLSIAAAAFIAVIGRRRSV